MNSRNAKKSIFCSPAEVYGICVDLPLGPGQDGSTVLHKRRRNSNEPRGAVTAARTWNPISEIQSCFKPVGGTL
jgi:hypothetical protein